VSKDKVNKSNKYKQAKQQLKNKNAEADKIKQQVKQATLAKVERDRELGDLTHEADKQREQLQLGV